MQIKVKMWIVGAFLFCGGLAPAVSAQVYKCQAGGRTAYQDKPCEGAREQAPNAVPAAHSGSAGLPAGARPVTPAADLAGWEPAYGRLAEAQVKWEATHGRSLEAV